MGLLVEADRKGQLAAFGFNDPQVPKPVDRLAPGGRGKPRARRSGQAVLRPSLKGGRERVLKRILGELKIAEDPDQRC
jgi:hypothetical protein